MFKFLKQKNPSTRAKLSTGQVKKKKGFTRLVDFGDAPTKVGARFSASPKLTTGFTLIEVLVALFILSLSIVAMMSVLASGISNTAYAKNKMIATYLAQEGVEYFRNMRDTNMLYYDSQSASNGWNNFVTNNTKGANQCTNNKVCNFDASVLNTITNCNAPTCTALNFISSSVGGGGYSNTGGGTATIFARKVTAIPVVDSNNEQITISSTVEWTQKSTKYSVTFSEVLFNWMD